MPRTLPTLLAFSLILSGCAVSREGQLRARAGRVETELLSERDRLSRPDVPPADRSARLAHLTSLRTQLSMANVARGIAPRVLDKPETDTAYDILDEVYSTIEWNIPLSPNDPQRQLPELFRGPQGLDFTALQRGPMSESR